MKRYFVSADADMPNYVDGQGGMPNADMQVGRYVYFSLGSIGTAGAGLNLVALLDEDIPAPESWINCPSVLDSVTTLASYLDASMMAALADTGLTGSETMYLAGEQLATFFPALKP